MKTQQSTFMAAVLASRKGASEMARGNYGKSVQVFREALLTLKAAVDSNLELPNDLQAWRLTTMPILARQGQMNSTNVDVDATSTTSSSHSSCTTFDRCFLIMPMPCHEKIPTSDKISLFSAALLFNIALAHQLEASSSTSTAAASPSALQNTALCLYNRATQILQGHLDRTSSDGAALMLAVSNNMTTLALDGMDWTAFGVYRDMMSSYLFLTTNTTGTFHANFFAGNLAASAAAEQRPAPAA